MAITNRERVEKALDLLRDGLGPYVAREIADALKSNRLTRESVRGFAEDRTLAEKPMEQWDASPLLKMMWDTWNETFRLSLGPAERSLVAELRNVRNRWAHQEPFSGDDTYRAMDSTERLLNAVSAAAQVEELGRLKMELLRVRFDEQLRSEKRRGAAANIESATANALKPWREVLNPHHDVASGRYQQAEFAADLWQVHLGEGTDEYRNPVEFFRRTFPTQSLKHLLKGAVERLKGTGGDPVVQLQTNFGGGKTHSMLALYHLFSGAEPTSLLGMDEVMREAKATSLPTVKRVVLVGNKLSPGSPSVKEDGTKVRTLWGELAWQLGGREAYDRIRADDELATSPGDALRALFNDYGPCLVLIDEWVAYARQLHEGADLPGGSFETHFSFAQALTESAKLARQCLLVISLPASDSGGPSPTADDLEVGGERGRAALNRLSNAVGRVESSWRPASADEGFEIVRRRLFEPLVDQAQFVARDAVAKAFCEMYRTQQQEFPAECNQSEYEQRIKQSYPIHPEVFDRLYNDWSTLARFQRTRGVLRLMAAVIHNLWESGDRNPLIMPANLAISEPRVQFELTRYLPDTWVPVIGKDVDGPNALPLRIDAEVPNLGRFHACRRVARTIYLGSAPTEGGSNKGLEDRRVKLGCVVPGETPAVFGDALRRLATAATYLYQDGSRYWYSTQPTVGKLADDRAEQFKSNPDAVHAELERRLRANLRQTGEFSRVHAMPQTGQDVPDDTDARLVVLGAEHGYSKDAGNAAEAAAKAIFETRGAQARLYRNTLAFLAADQTRMTDLDEALRRFLAWESIVGEAQQLDLSPHQVKHAETQKTSANGTVEARLPETYQWLLVPVQAKPQAAMTWEAYKLTGTDALAVRASKKLRSEELLVTTLAGTRLRMDLDGVPLWRGDHVSVAQLADDFARYTYLPRLKNPGVLCGAVEDGVGLLLWAQESFALADSYDEALHRYRGLRASQNVSVGEGNVTSLVVNPAVAARQFQAELPAPAPAPSGPGEGPAPAQEGDPHTPGDPKPRTPPTPPTMKRYHGSATLNATRVGRDAGQIADAVISHLSGLVGSEVTVRIEIEARLPGGAPDTVVRTVLENGRTLKFDEQGFETE